MRIQVTCLCGQTTATLDSDHPRASVMIFCPICDTNATIIPAGPERSVETEPDHDQ